MLPYGVTKTYSYHTSNPMDLCVDSYESCVVLEAGMPQNGKGVAGQPTHYSEPSTSRKGDKMNYTDQSTPRCTAARATRGVRRSYAGALRPAYRAAWVAAATFIAAGVSLGSPAASAGPTRIGGEVFARALPATSSRCSLNVVYGVAGESAAADARQTASWTLLRANGWTVSAPSSSWHLSASDAGADVTSPDGLSDASLATWYQLGRPWSLKGLAAKILSQVSFVHTICSSPVERSAAATTQATELTGRYQGEAIHAVIILSVMAPNGTETSVGETRSLYTSTAGWSTAQERMLMLVIKRAIQTPRGL